MECCNKINLGHIVRREDVLFLHCCSSIYTVIYTIYQCLRRKKNNLCLTKGTVNFRHIMREEKA